LTDFVWLCESCEAGYWLFIDTTDATKTNPRSCLQNQVTNDVKTLCYYGRWMTTSLDNYTYVSNTCFVSGTTNADENKNAYLAPNLANANVFNNTKVAAIADFYVDKTNIRPEDLA
jgi:hypothetical protein